MGEMFALLPDQCSTATTNARKTQRVCATTPRNPRAAAVARSSSPRPPQAHALYLQVPVKKYRKRAESQSSRPKWQDTPRYKRTADAERGVCTLQQRGVGLTNGYRRPEPRIRREYVCVSMCAARCVCPTPAPRRPARERGEFRSPARCGEAACPRLPSGDERASPSVLAVERGEVRCFVSPQAKAVGQLYKRTCAPTSPERASLFFRRNVRGFSPCSLP